MKVLHCVRNGWRLVAFRGSLYPQRFQPLLCATDSSDQAGTLLPEEGWRGREIFGLAKEESRVKGLGNGYF